MKIFHYTVYPHVNNDGTYQSAFQENHQYFDELITCDDIPIRVYRLGNQIGFSYTDKKNNKVYWHSEESNLQDVSEIVQVLRDRAKELFKQIS